MSNAQSILLILIFFYLVECLKWAPIGAVSLRTNGFTGEKFSLLRPTMIFFGMGKSMFLAPILPSLQLQLITDRTDESAHQHSRVKLAVGVRRRFFRLRARTLLLRTFSFYIFITYFVFLPGLYLRFGEGSYVYTTVGVGYLLQAFCALCYFSTHRRLFPRKRAIRALHTFYNLALPWHAMRASDELFINSSAEWSELAMLGAATEPEQTDGQLALYWRQSQLAKSAPYSKQTLQSTLNEVGMSSEAAMQSVIPEAAGQNYCPCCGIIYRAEVLYCLDCHNLRLQQS